MITEPGIVSDEWNAYSAERDGLLMFVSFDESATRETPPAELRCCARVQIPIHAPNGAGGPDSAEAKRLYEMEDELVAILEEDGVRCRLVGRLTYDGLRELVFQLEDWESFRPPVGFWLIGHDEYDIDVSEHDGWDFFDKHVRPRIEDRIWMMDRSVVGALIETGSDPQKEHSLDYVFAGDEKGLRQVARVLKPRGYEPVGKFDPASGQILLAKRMPLDLPAIVEESIANYHAAHESNVACDGWGAAVVR